MTITYTSDVATCSGFGCFWKVLWRWKGSIYKLVWKDLCAFLAMYFALSSVYRFALDDYSKSYFEKVVQYVNKTYTKLIPLSFVLGFYVTVIMGRWWNQVSGVPWPDISALYVTSCMTNNKTPRARMFRRTIVRYLNLTFVMSMSKVSPRVKRRFPTLDHMIEAGLLTEHEKKLLGEVEKKTVYSTWFVPIVWCCGTTKQAFREGMFHGERSYLALLDRIAQFRSSCGSILTYDWISVPLVYTQVVTFAVYAYFLADLFGNQWIATNKDDIDLYFPLFPFLQFLFYMGWLKVAEVLINPFGDDDEDFELNWVIDRNIQIAYLVADDLHEMHPELTKDMHWQEGVPQDIPHTIASEMQKEEPFIDGSTGHITAESMQDDADIAPQRPKTPMFDDGSINSPSPGPGKGGRTPLAGRRSVIRGPSRTNSVSSRPGSRLSRRNFPGSSVLRSMSIFKGKQNPNELTVSQGTVAPFDVSSVWGSFVKSPPLSDIDDCISSNLGDEGKLDRMSLAGTSVTSRRSVMTQIGDSEGGDGDWEDVALPASIAGSSYNNTDDTVHVLIDIPANVVKGSPKLHPSSAAGHRRSDSTKSTGTMMFEMDDVGHSQQDGGNERRQPLETLEEGTEDEPSTDKS